MRHFLFALFLLFSFTSEAGLIDQRFRTFFPTSLQKMGVDLDGNACRVIVSYQNAGRFCFEVRVETLGRASHYRLFEGASAGRDCPVSYGKDVNHLHVANRPSWGGCYSNPATANPYEIGLNREGNRLAVAVSNVGYLEQAPVCFIEM